VTQEKLSVITLRSLRFIALNSTEAVHSRKVCLGWSSFGHLEKKLGGQGLFWVLAVLAQPMILNFFSMMVTFKFGFRTALTLLYTNFGVWVLIKAFLSKFSLSDKSSDSNFDSRK
jgi:hypothetical protein